MSEALRQIVLNLDRHRATIVLVKMFDAQAHSTLDLGQKVKAVLEGRGL